ncbi:MAG: LysR family transcriptional regulator [Pseudomonadota bacterium]
MDFGWFRDLGRLADTGHFSRAAEISHVSQPAFSRRIKALEDWAGVALVDRSRHPVKLTSAGAQMLEAGQQALERLETERREIQEAQAQPENYVVTFGAQHSIGWRFYPTWLQAFEDAFGPIMSRLRADDLPNCIADLASQQIDFVIAYSSDYSAGLDEAGRTEAVLIGRDVLVPVCKPQADGRPVFQLSPKTSIQVPYLQFGSKAPISQHIEPLLVKHDLHRRLGVVYENSMAGALRIRAQDGAGVAWLPQTLIAPDLESGKLTLTGDVAWHVKLDINLHRRTGAGNALTHAIWDYLSASQPLSLSPQL